MKIPDETHPITITPAPNAVRALFVSAKLL